MYVFKKYILHLQRKYPQGALAHLARAFDWQSKGDEFESRMLHQQIKHCISIIYKKCNALFVLHSLHPFFLISRKIAQKRENLRSIGGTINIKKSVAAATDFFITTYSL